MLVGITGGIGAGKSTVSDYLKLKGYPVLDADEVAKEIVRPGTETLLKLAEAFGEGIINSDGTLNRQGLSDIVFSDPLKKKLLDQITHEKVIQIMLERAKSFSEEQIVFMDVPLLFESGMDRYMEQVWLVDADEEIRILRVMDRDKKSRDEIIKRIKNQMSRDEKICKAGMVLDNSKDELHLYRQVDEILNALEREV